MIILIFFHLEIFRNHDIFIFKNFLNFKVMAKKSLEQVIAENRELGFDPEIIQIAYANVNGDSEKVIEEIFRLQ